jgi:hypothetical protein
VSPPKGPRATTLADIVAMQEVREDQPYAPDWIVDQVVDNGPRAYYRFTVAGRNANLAPDHIDYRLNLAPDHIDYRFSWRVPRLGWRYDLSGARLVPSIDYSAALRAS